jgi:hypothetical protein
MVLWVNRKTRVILCARSPVGVPCGQSHQNVQRGRVGAELRQLAPEFKARVAARYQAARLL